MTEIEYQAYKLVRKKDWYHAIEIFDQIINSGLYNQIPKDRIVSCLLGRSECNLELGQHEAVIADCRSIIKLLADGNENNFKIRARKRLLHSLFFLRRFSELETETRELLLSGGKIKDNIELLKLLERLSSVLHMASNQKGNGIPLENEFKELESHFEALVSQDEFIKYKKAPDNLEYQFKNEFTNNEMPLIMTDTIVCSYCCITFSTKSDLLAHCQSETHQNVIMSDEGRDWKWRPPPRGFKADTYTLCESFMDNSVCRYGAQCVEAHGPEELAEWKERFKYRRMKLQRAYEKELYGKSYTERLLEKWVAAPSPDKVMKEKVDDVEDICNKELATTVSSKSSKTEWMFILKTNKMLKAVALLQDAHRTHFALRQIILGIKKNIKDKPQEVELNSDQEWYSKVQIEEGNDTDFIEHHVKVSFSTDIYGTFRQSIVFDFGSEPVLVKHLCVDVLPAADIDKLKDINKELVLLNTERWYSENSEIVGFTSTIIPSKDINEIERENNLQMTYPFPNLDKFILTQSTIMEKKLTKNNYRARMHELLYVEEVARYEQVARYNLTSKLRITRSYLLSPSGVASTTAKYSHSGELFALMTLGKNVSEDTSAGRLILNNCTTVLLTADASKRKHDEKLKVYEALIEDKGKNVIYLRLSSLTVKELAIKPDVDYLAEIQFQLNRIPYCEWHLAIDKIADFSLIFPDTYLEPSIPWSPQRQWSDKMDAKLNLKQKEAIVAITTPVNIPLPPILIIGPFGTGKTYTLAQAIKQLLTQQDTRILICTHSNSAADLYIKDYIHPYVEAGHEEARPLRIYYHKRWVMTVNQTVQKYCLIDTSENVRNFRIPTLEDIFKTRIVVVTLSTSMYLSTLGLPKGYFTHILLDEAAQAMECEAIMPLALADNTTRIVLAGDHMQLSPELFSQFAKERQLHLSLLERLYDHYPSHYPCKILLCENYRAHEAIVQFTSELFYEQKLICSGKQPRHDKFYPLTFFTTRGEDVQDQNSTAYYNDSEVYEIVERVCELKKHWPSAWGKMDEHSVGIMTPYADQVFRIRSALRKRRMGGISVERVLNVQGKQFRAVFLSTVRTRRTCVNSKMSVDEMDYGFLSNLKLLNTAITRAQSLVAVVGDPVALCSIGRCRKVWERFISICNENRSLFGISWSLLRNQLDGVELKKTYVLNPLAPEFIPRKYQIESYIKMPPVAENSKTNDYAYPTASLKTTDNPVGSPFIGSAPIYSFPSMYYYQPPNQQSTVPFFPLPPLQSNILQTGPLQLNSLHTASLQSGLLPSNPLLQSGPMKSNSGMLPTAQLQNNTMQSNPLHMDALQSNPLQVGPLQTLQSTSLQSLNSGQLQSNTIHPNLLQSNGLQLGPLQTGPNLQSGPLSSNSLQTVMQPTSLQTGHLQLGPLHSNSLQQNSLQSAHLQSAPLQLGPLQSNSLSQGPLPSGPLQLNPLQSVHLPSNAMQSNLQQNHIPFSSSAAAVMGPWSLNCPQIPTNTSIPGWPPKIPVSNTDMNDGTNIQRNNVVTPLLRFPDVQYPNNMITNSQNPASLQQLNTLQQQLDRYTGETYIPRDTFIRNPQQSSNLLIGNKLIESADICPIDKNQIPYLNNIDLQQNIPVPNSQNMIYPQTVSLLPPDMNVIDMLKRPQSYQIEWYLHLKNMNGISTANKFLELLISAKKQQEQIMCTNYPQLIDNVVEKPNVYTPLPNGYSSPNIKPLCADMSRMNMQPPNYIDEQRILNSKPLILKDLELPYTEGSRIFVDRFPDVLDQIQQSFQSRPVQNIPLYKRQSMLNSSTSNNVDQKIQKQIPASSTNNHSEYSQHSQIENRNMPVYDNFMQQHLIPEPQQPEQIRINSNDLQNKELLDEVANRQTTYASVLRTNALPNKVDLGRNDLFARDLGQIPSSRNSTGLYQYFS